MAARVREVKMAVLSDECVGEGEGWREGVIKPIVNFDLVVWHVQV